jgi:cytochrome c5
MKGVAMRIFRIAWALVPRSLALTAGLLLSGCAEDQPSATGGATTRPAVAESAVAQTSGAELWSNNCARCHNLRSPDTYSSAQWELAVHHMRLRANLTGEEAGKITAFLKSAN